VVGSPTRQRKRVVGAIAILLMIAAVVAVTVRWRTPTGERLADSFDRAADGLAVVGPCESSGGGVWRCHVEDDPGSGTSTSYTLRLDTDECWSVLQPSSRSASSLTGCI